MSSVSTVDHLISNGLAVIKDTRFDQRAQQGARRPSQLAYCGPIGECRNLHIAVHVEPTLEFTIRVSYTNASTGESVHVPLPPPSLLQVPPVVADMLDCGKLMLCGHSVSVRSAGKTDAILAELIERARALLLWLSSLRTCDGVLHNVACRDPADSASVCAEIDGVNARLRSKSKGVQFTARLNCEHAGVSVSIHASTCSPFLPQQSGSGRHAIRCTSCGKFRSGEGQNLSQLFENNHRAVLSDLAAETEATAKRPKLLHIEDVVDATQLAQVATTAPDPDERLFAAWLHDAMMRKFCHEPQPTHPYAAGLVDLAGHLYSTLGANKYSKMRDSLPAPLPTDRTVRAWRAVHEGARPPLQFVVEIASLVEQFQAAAHSLPLPYEAALWLLRKHCVLSFDGMKMRRQLVALRGRDGGIFAGVAAPNTAGHLVRASDGDETGQQVALSCLTFTLRSIFAGPRGVAAVVPLSTSEPTADELAPIISRVVKLLTQAGFDIMCTVADGARAHERMHAFQNPVGPDMVDLALAFAEFRDDQSALAAGTRTAAKTSTFGIVPTSLITAQHRAGTVWRARGGGRGERAPASAQAPSKRAAGIAGGPEMMAALQAQTHDKDTRLPDVTHVVKRVGTNVRAGFTFEIAGVTYEIGTSNYLELLQCLNRSSGGGGAEALGPLIVHERVLSAQRLKASSRVHAMDPRVQRKYLGSDGTLLKLLDTLSSTTRQRFAGLEIFLREFAPGLEMLTSGTIITAAMLASDGEVGQKLRRSRKFLDCARFNDALQADLVACFDFWIATVPNVFATALEGLRQMCPTDAQAQSFELRTVPWRWTQDWCEQVHGIFRSSAGSTDTPTIKSIADTALRINKMSSSERAKEVRLKRQQHQKDLRMLRRRLKAAVGEMVNDKR